VPNSPATGFTNKHGQVLVNPGKPTDPAQPWSDAKLACSRCGHMSKAPLSRILDQQCLSLANDSPCLRPSGLQPRHHMLGTDGR
jgi:hypothetical protein